MKKIRSKMKALEWPQDNMLICFCAQGKITPKSVVGSGRNSNSFKFFFFLHVLVTCKNEEDSMSTEFAGVATTFLP